MRKIILLTIAIPLILPSLGCTATDQGGSFSMSHDIRTKKPRPFTQEMFDALPDPLKKELVMTGKLPSTKRTATPYTRY